MPRSESTSSQVDLTSFTKIGEGWSGFATTRPQDACRQSKGNSTPSQANLWATAIWASKYMAIGGMILNQVQHAEPHKFARITLPPAPNLIQRFPQIVKDAEDEIASLEASGRRFNEYPMAANELTCYSRYGPCPHMEKCQWGILGE